VQKFRVYKKDLTVAIGDENKPEMKQDAEVCGDDF
jgi:hypothetical protein